MTAASDRRPQQPKQGRRQASPARDRHQSPPPATDVVRPGAIATSLPSTAVLGALAVCGLVFLYHVYTYWFLTDDAFIAFRYARNLGDGYGLVFNPGFEAVEGYTNFLWVLLLGGLHVITRLPPHVSANFLSVGCGIALWALTVWFCWRHAGDQPWLVLIPALWLALSRSFAVWCTSGLETKLFELLVVAAVLRGVEEVECRDPRWWRPALLLALATLTRPDGLLIAAVFFAVRFVCEAAQRSLRIRAVALGAAVFVTVVGLHLLFRLAYYGDLMPNTYYAKLGGSSWWDMGLLYLLTFLQEYGAIVWLPLVLIGVVGLWGEGRSMLALAAAAIVVAHATYVAYCGGDHFEYRPLDVYFPFMAILLFEGARYVARRWHQAAAFLWGAAACAAVALVPAVSHLDFPPEYHTGFPGASARLDGTQDLVDLRRHSMLAQLPGMAGYIASYNQAVRLMSSHFVGLRQEEHRLFLASVEPEGRRLGELVQWGSLARDTYVAMPCVGAIPYFSNLRTLDTLGLTDREIAHQKMPPSAQRVMAHDKHASLNYLQSSGVDVVSLTPHLLYQPSEIAGLRSFARQRGPRAGIYISPQPVVDGLYFYGMLLKPAVDVPHLAALDLRPAWQ